MKRKMLIERGYPRQALLITVVRDQNNEGHAILTVKTNHGEFILDNLTDELKPVEPDRLSPGEAPEPAGPERLGRARPHRRPGRRLALKDAPTRTTNPAPAGFSFEIFPRSPYHGCFSRSFRSGSSISLRVNLFDFDLPEDRIALRPAEPRDSARLLVVAPDEFLRDAHVRRSARLLAPGRRAGGQ